MIVIAHIIRTLSLFIIFGLFTTGTESDYGKWFLLVICLIVITIVSEFLGKAES
jgi:hypothetical protein